MALPACEAKVTSSEDRPAACRSGDDRVSMAKEPWRIGVLFSRTGATGAIEQTQLNGTLLALSEVNAAGGVLDRPLEAVAYDPASNLRIYRQFAERLLTVDLRMLHV